MSRPDPLNLFGEEEESVQSVQQAAEPAEETQAPAEPISDDVAHEAAPEAAPAEEESTAGEPRQIPEPQAEEPPRISFEEAMEPLGEKLDSLIEHQTRLQEQLAAMDQLFSSRIMHTASEEKVIDRMHAELQKYKDGMYAKLIRPIMLDVIGVRESISKMAASFRTKPEGQQDIPIGTFEMYTYDMQDILEKNGVTLFKSEAGTPFIPLRQKVVKKVITHEEALHGMVAESLSDGYEFEGRVIFAERINVYFYEKPAQEETPEPPAEDNGGADNA